MKLNNVSNRNAIFIIFEGIMAAIVLNLYNPFVQMFAKRLGAGDVHVALINSIPPLIAIIVLIPCSIFIDRVDNKKFVTGLLIAINSIFYVAIAFVPFMPDGLKVIIYILFVGFMNWPGSLYVTTWQSFFADTFGGGSHANLVYSLRSKYSSFMGLLTALITGFILSAVPKSDGERVVIYQLFYVSCFVFSIVQILFLSGIRSSSPDKEAVTTTDKTKPSFNIGAFKDVFTNKTFLIFCGCAFAFNVTWQMGWPLFFIYHVDYVKINEFRMGIINVGAGLASFFAYSLWNKVTDKKGSNITAIIGALGTALNPFFYALGLPFYLVLLVQTVGGAFSAGFTFALFCGLLEILPQERKTIYISTYNTFINIAGFISPLLGVWIYKYTDIFKAMVIIGVLRLLSVFLFVWREVSNRKSKKVAKAGQISANIAG